MKSKKIPRKNINFRETKSERSAANAYRNFAKNVKEKYNKFIKG